jgi:cell wall-associated NlpC family hydrolase
MLFAVAVPAMAQQQASPKAWKKGAVQAVTEREANPAGPFARLSSMQRDSIIEHTRNLLGVKYKWAGLNPAKGLDCSGIVKYVFAKLGVELPHRAAELAKMGDPITKDTAAMQPGDLLVFGKAGKRISHVGIYIGDGKMIHASSSSHHVVETEVVKYRPAGGLQWKGVRRIVALDSATIENEPEPLPSVR